LGRRGSAGCGDYGVPAVEKLGDEFKADTSGGADYEPGLSHYQGSKVIKEAYRRRRTQRKEIWY
jgi:hypothetical protein